MWHNIKHILWGANEFLTRRLLSNLFQLISLSVRTFSTIFRSNDLKREKNVKNTNSLHSQSKRNTRSDIRNGRGLSSIPRYYLLNTYCANNSRKCQIVVTHVTKQKRLHLRKTPMTVVDLYLDMSQNIPLNEKNSHFNVKTI